MGRKTLVAVIALERLTQRASPPDRVARLHLPKPQPPHSSRQGIATPSTLRPHGMTSGNVTRATRHVLSALVAVHRTRAAHGTTLPRDVCRPRILHLLRRVRLPPPVDPRQRC